MNFVLEPKGRVIERLRKRWPQYNWTYRAWHWECEAGYVARVAMCSCDDVCEHTGSLCFYKNEGTPEWV